MNSTQSQAQAADTVSLAGILWLIMICALWGLNSVSIKFSLPGVPPILSAAIRDAGAAVLVYLYCRLKGQPVWLSKGDLGHGLVIGFLFGLDFLFLYWGLAFTNASRSILFLYTMPFWVALGAHFLLPDDRLNLTKSAGLILAFGGMTAVFGADAANPNPLYWVGDLMEMAAALSWAATSLYLKRILIRKNFHHAQTLFAQLLWSLPVLIVAALIFESGTPLHLDLAVIAALAYQTVVVAFFSYLLWFWMIHHFPVSRLSAFTFLTPMFGVIAGGLILGEDLPLLLWAGLALIAAGIYLVNRPPKPRAG